MFNKQVIDGLLTFVVGCLYGYKLRLNRQVYDEIINLARLRYLFFGTFFTFAR